MHITGGGQESVWAWLGATTGLLSLAASSRHAWRLVEAELRARPVNFDELSGHRFEDITTGERPPCGDADGEVFGLLFSFSKTSQHATQRMEFVASWAVLRPVERWSQNLFLNLRWHMKGSVPIQQPSEWHSKDWMQWSCL